MHHGKGRMDLGIVQQRSGVDPGLLRDGAELMAVDVISHFADKSGLPAQLLQHGQYVAGSAAGVGLPEGIALLAEPGLGEVDQQFA